MDLELSANLKRLLVLESVRQTGNNVRYPFNERWDTLGDEIQFLIEQGLLSIDSKLGACSITTEGKKSLLLFQDERKDLLAKLETYKEFIVGDKQIDARIPVEAFRLRKQDPKHVSQYLFTIAVFSIWDDFFAMIKKIHKHGSKWQPALFESFYFNALKRVQVDAWKALGRTENEAIIVGTKLTNPTLRNALIPLTRN